MTKDMTMHIPHLPFPEHGNVEAIKVEASLTVGFEIGEDGQPILDNPLVNPNDITRLLQTTAMRLLEEDDETALSLAYALVSLAGGIASVVAKAIQNEQQERGLAINEDLAHELQRFEAAQAWLRDKMGE